MKSIDKFKANIPDGRKAPKNELILVKGGVVQLGRKNNEIYGWDNEFGETTYDVSSFKASKYLVSNKEFLEFIDDGGYKKIYGGVKKGDHGVITIRLRCRNFGN